MTANRYLSAPYFFAILIGLAGLVSIAHAEKKEPLKQAVGTLQATIYVGTNGDVDKLGEKAKPIKKNTIESLQKINEMQFQHYRELGADTQSILRRYENWLAPLKPSKDILLSYESRGATENQGLRLDLKFWQQQRIVMKSDPLIYLNKPLFILGPKWRGGRIIIAIQLTDLISKK